MPGRPRSATLSGVDRERRLNLLVVALTIVAIFAVPYVVVKTHVIGAVLGEDRVDCDDFEFDRTDWVGEDEDDRQDQAQGLAECDYLSGLQRDEVAAMLDEGRDRHPNPDRWAYSAGWTNDFIGPGDGVTLNVYFGKDDAVRSASLSRPID